MRVRPCYTFSWGLRGRSAINATLRPRYPGESFMMRQACYIRFEAPMRQAAGPKYGSCGARARPRYGRTTRRAHVLRPLEGVIIWGPRMPICTRIVDQEGTERSTMRQRCVLNMARRDPQTQTSMLKSDKVPSAWRTCVAQGERTAKSVDT